MFYVLSIGEIGFHDFHYTSRTKARPVWCLNFRECFPRFGWADFLIAFLPDGQCFQLLHIVARSGASLPHCLSYHRLLIILYILQTGKSGNTAVSRRHWIADAITLAPSFSLISTTLFAQTGQEVVESYLEKYQAAYGEPAGEYEKESEDDAKRQQMFQSAIEQNKQSNGTTAVTGTLGVTPPLVKVSSDQVDVKNVKVEVLPPEDIKRNVTSNAA